MERKKAEDEARKKKKRELLKKAKGSDDSAEESKQAAIKEAMERVKAKRAAQSGEPANTRNLTKEQLKAIAEADARRKKLKEEN
jgi:hypothetical protein